MQVPVMPSRPHEDAVVESFRDDPGFALYMLSHSLEEGDEAVFLTTLRRVAKAFGGISQVARQANLNETTSTGCFPGRAIRSSAASWLFCVSWVCGWQWCLLPLRERLQRRLRRVWGYRWRRRLRLSDALRPALSSLFRRVITLFL